MIRVRNANTEAVVLHVISQEVVIDYNQERNEKLDSIYNGITSSLPELEEMGGICFVFTYRQDQQPPNAPTYDMDGQFAFTTIEGKKVAAIAIADAALAKGEDYATMVMLHEFAHAIVPDEFHNEKFHQYLNYLLYEYNKRNGTNIKNDYEGL